MSTQQVLTLIIGGMIGVLCTKGIPLGGRVLLTAWEWAIKRAGGWLAFRSFEKMYLDSIISEHGNLNLTGVLHVDASAKPKLEDVFISLTVGKYESSSEALAEELEVRLLEMVQLVDKRDSQLVRRLKKTLLIPHYRGRMGQIGAFLSLLQRDDVSLVKAEQALYSKIAEAYNYLRAIPNISGPTALKNYDKLAILGAPGAGKTTLLQWISITYARHKAGDRLLRRPNLHQQRLDVKEWKFPIFIRLSSIAPLLIRKSSDGRDPTIVEVLPSLLQPHLQSFRDSQSYFTQQLEQGKAIVLLDGLDEVPGDEEFQAVAKAVRSLVSQYGKNQFVISSRMAGWRGGIGVDFRIYQVNELSDTQIESFIDAWYSTIEHNQNISDPEAKSQAVRRQIELLATRKAEELKQAIRDSTGLRRLSVNPLLLSVVALVHRSRHVLPKERAKLYGDCSSLMLLQWDAPKNLRDDPAHLTYLEKESIIRRIAFSLHTGEIGAASGGREAERSVIEDIVGHMLPSFGRNSADAPVMVEHLITRSGMLSERHRNVLAFAHHTFQEYYTALELATREPREVIEFLTKDTRLESDWWKEVITLYACLIPDAKPLLTFLSAPERDNVFRTRLKLALGCLVERGSVDLFMRDTIINEVRSIRVGRDHLRSRTLGDPAIQYLARWSTTPMWLMQSVRHSTARSVVAPRERAWSDELTLAIQSSDPDERAAAISGSLLLAPELRHKPFLECLLTIARSGRPMEKAAVQAQLWAFPEIAGSVISILQASFDDAMPSSVVACCYAVMRGLEKETLSIPERELIKIVPVVMGKSLQVLPLLLQWGQLGSPDLLEAVVSAFVEADSYPDTSRFVRARPQRPTERTMRLLAKLLQQSDQRKRVFACGLLSGLMTHSESAAHLVNFFTYLIREGQFVPMGDEFVTGIRGGSSESIQILVEALLAQDVWCRLQAVKLVLMDPVPQEASELGDVIHELLFDVPHEVSTALIRYLRLVDPVKVPVKTHRELLRAASENHFRQGREYDIFALLANIHRVFHTEDVLVDILEHRARFLQAVAALAISRVGANLVSDSALSILQRMAGEEKHRIALQWERIYGLKYQRAGAIAVWMLSADLTAVDLISDLALDNPAHRSDLTEISGWIAEVERSERVLDLLIYAYARKAADVLALDRVVAENSEYLFDRVVAMLKGGQPQLGINLLSRYRLLFARRLAGNQVADTDERDSRTWDLDEGLEACLADPSINDCAWDFYECDWRTALGPYSSFGSCLESESSTRFEAATPDLSR